MDPFEKWELEQPIDQSKEAEAQAEEQKVLTETHAEVWEHLDSVVTSIIEWLWLSEEDKSKLKDTIESGEAGDIPTVIEQIRNWKTVEEALEAWRNAIDRANTTTDYAEAWNNEIIILNNPNFIQNILIKLNPDQRKKLEESNISAIITNYSNNIDIDNPIVQEVIKTFVSNIISGIRIWKFNPWERHHRIPHQPIETVTNSDREDTPDEGIKDSDLDKALDAADKAWKMAENEGAKERLRNTDSSNIDQMKTVWLENFYRSIPLAYGIRNLNEEDIKTMIKEGTSLIDGIYSLKWKDDNLKWENEYDKRTNSDIMNISKFFYDALDKNDLNIDFNWWIQLWDDIIESLHKYISE